MGYTLRPYQLAGINNVIRQLTHNNQSAVVFATGSGKTDIATIVASELLHNGIVNKAIAATPFTSIVNDFASKSGDHFITSAPNNRQFNIHKIENCFSDDDSNDRIKNATINHIIDVIKSPDNAFIVSTHAAIASDKIIKEINSHEDLSNVLLIIDEAHHCYFSDDDDESQTTEYKKSTKLGELANSMLMRGAKVLYLTATPYRTNGSRTELIFDSIECNPVIRTLGEQMKDGYSPKVKTEYVQVDYTLSGKNNIFGDKTTSKIDSTQLKTVLPVIAETYINDGYPKSIWLIPAGNAEESSAIVKQWIEENITLPTNIQNIRGRRIPNVLVAIGKDKKGILEALASDKNNGGREYDIVLGCRKFDEGTDVPSASHLYMIGLPSNVRLFHQRVGRVTRMKSVVNGYSKWFGDQYLDNSKVVFIAPIKLKNGKQAKVKNFDYNVGKQLLHCIFASESYAEYCEATNINHSIRMAFEKLESEEDKNAKNECKEHIKALFSDLELTMVKNDSQNEFEILTGLALNPHETIGDKYRQVQASDLSIEEKREAYALLLNHLPEDVKASEGFQALITKMVSKMVSDTNQMDAKNSLTPNIKMAPYTIMCSEFEQIITEYQDCEINSDSYKAVNKVFSELNAESIAEWAEKCSYALGEEAGKKWVNEICIFRKKYNRNPSKESSDINEKQLGQKLGALKHAKKEYAHARRFYSSYQLIADDYGFNDLFDVITEDDRENQCKEWVATICEFKKINSRNPSSGSKSSDERRLGEKLGQLKKAKNNIKKVKNNIKISSNQAIFYPSLQLIADSYGFYDLFNTITEDDREKIANEWVVTICEFIKLHNRSPRSHCDNDDERRLGQKLHALKKSKKAPSADGQKFYPSLQLIADSYGFYDLFDVLDDDLREANAKECVIQICDFKKKYGKTPTYISKNKDEKYLGMKLRLIKVNKRDGMWYPSLQLIADSYGFYDLFDVLDDDLREANAKSRLIELCEYITRIGRVPSQKSIDSEESQYGHRLSHFKTAKQGKGSSKWFDSLQLIADSYGFNDLFDIRDINEDNKQKVTDICEFIKLTGNQPTRSKGEYEYMLSVTLSNYRSAKKKGSRDEFFNSLQPILDVYGFHDLFDTIDLNTRIESSKQKLIEICEFRKLYNRNPSCESKNVNEVKLYTKLSHLRNAKKKQSKAFLSIFQVIAEEYGYPDLFDVQDLEESSKSKVTEICEFIKINNRNPSQASKDLNEKSLNKKLSYLRQAKKGSCNGVFYPSCQVIAEEYGYPDLFETKK